MNTGMIHEGTLADRILDAFPSGSYALAGLLRLLDIVESTEVPTAAVECRIQPRMLINPVFVERHADTPEKLLALVMHELHHVLLGHTTLFPRVTPAQNFVFDAVINGVVCRMFPGTDYTSFFTEFYRDDRFPECLLRPAAGWPSRTINSVPGLEALPEPLRQRAIEVHTALYSEAGASYHEVYSLLPQILEGGNESGDLGVPLLGGHDQGGDAHSGLEHKSPLLFGIVREIVEQWPQPPDPIRGRSLADVLESSTVSPARSVSNRSVLRSLIRKVAGLGGRGRFRRISEDSITIQTPVPSADRRSIVLRSLGQEPLLHSSTTTWRRIHPAGERVHIYLDVSGSMEGVLKPLYGAVLDCEELVFPTIHLFSDQVADITVGELRRGTCRTTGGTDIACVASHMLRNEVRRAVLVTDGWVGLPSGQHKETLATARLAVAYLGAVNELDLASVADYTAILKIEDSQ